MSERVSGGREGGREGRGGRDGRGGEGLTYLRFIGVHPHVNIM